MMVFPYHAGEKKFLTMFNHGRENKMMDLRSRTRWDPLYTWRIDDLLYSDLLVVDTLFQPLLSSS